MYLDNPNIKLPEDPERAMYYMLGTYQQYRNEMAELLQRPDLLNLPNSPEKAFELAREHALSLQEKWLRQRIKHSTSLQEAHNLREQLHALIKRISLRLVHGDEDNF